MWCRVNIQAIFQEWLLFNANSAFFSAISCRE